MELHVYWPLVRPGLERVKAKTKAPWIAEDLYAAVAAGKATMHVGFVDQRYAGVLVLTMNTEPFSNEKSLLIWACFICHPEALRYGLEDVRRIAARYGLGKLRFGSPRRGWERRLRTEGFQVTERIFERTL